MDASSQRIEPQPYDLPGSLVFLARIGSPCISPWLGRRLSLESASWPPFSSGSLPRDEAVVAVAVLQEPSLSPLVSTGHRMLKWKVEPCFLPAEVAHMLPPIASTSLLQMARPSPEPPCCRVRDESTCSQRLRSQVLGLSHQQPLNETLCARLL